MPSGHACNSLCRPCPNEAGQQPTPCVPFSMRSSTCCVTFCPWRYLPCNFPPWQTVFYHIRRLRLKGTWFRLLTARRRGRTRTGRQECTAECGNHGRGIRVKIVEESAGISGFDAHKGVKERKRHILVDMLDLLVSVYVIPAGLHDTKCARCCHRIPDLDPGFSPANKPGECVSSNGCETWHKPANLCSEPFSSALALVLHLCTRPGIRHDRRKQCGVYRGPG